MHHKEDYLREISCCLIMSHKVNKANVFTEQHINSIFLPEVSQHSRKQYQYQAWVLVTLNSQLWHCLNLLNHHDALVIKFYNTFPSHLAIREMGTCVREDFMFLSSRDNFALFECISCSV